MAYTKTQWVNNTTPINDTNLNKIEQGIYDNSLVVDAVTDTLNPTDTETYKTAELTEGQITDVIGISDIVIQGQTSQDETPTPSAPVDVNVVSGSNVINTTSKNLLDKDGEISVGSTLSISATATDRISIRVKQKLKANTTYTVITNLNTSNFYWAFVLGTEVSPWAPDKQLYDSGWKTTNYWSYTTSQECYINIPIRNSSNTNININDVKDYWFMLYEGVYDSSISYEPHQGKELTLDLLIENLLDMSTLSTGYVSGAGTIETTGIINEEKVSDYIKVKPNTLYKFKIFESSWSGFNRNNWLGIGEYTSNDESSFVERETMTTGTQDYQIITTGANTNYVRISARGMASATKAQFSKGKYNIYTPYGTEPIELCKIGNYQDYFYKSGSKWYLHKEIGKVVLNGTETWSGLTDLGDCIRVNTSFRCNGQAQQVSNYFKYNNSYALDEEHFYNYGNYFYVFLLKTTASTIEEVKTWLSNHNTTIYYVLETSTNTEITDTTLISQLEAIYNAPLYEQTNITQANNDLPMVLDITACKDNINGIKAWIRK